MSKRSLSVAFKAYDQNQISLLPPSLDELISGNHPVRVVSQVIDKLDIDPILKKYHGGGCSSFHPRMLLKVLVYAYINNTYSSRKIEAALKENIHYMWISGMNTPDHNTINRFRSERLKDVLREVFTQVVMLLNEEGLLNIKELYTDGTKIEANANRYTFVWGNAIKTNKEKIATQLKELWKYAQTIAASELPDTDPTRFDKIDASKVEQTIEQINEALKDKPVDKKVTQKLNYAKKNWPSSLKKYKTQEHILAGRNSYSKTDPDASFMRMKEDHMLNGQLKAAYNFQISTNNQYIINYSLHQTTADTTTLQTHLEIYRLQYNQNPGVVTADAGYGSEQNYTWLEENNIENYVKYNYFDKDQDSKPDKKYPFKSDTLFYNEEHDFYVCPMGQKMECIAAYTTTTKNGFKQNIKKYKAANCEGCPLRGVCYKAKGNRTIEINHNLRQYKTEVRKKLNSEEGIYHRKKRPCDVEPVFGNIKNNHNFKRFMLRSKPKVEIEAGLLAIAHNLRKKVA
ncbi:MAG: IS1182 family transposase [Ginsengibacter sp.]